MKNVCCNQSLQLSKEVKLLFLSGSVFLEKQLLGILVFAPIHTLVLTYILGLFSHRVNVLLC